MTESQLTEDSLEMLETDLEQLQAFQVLLPAVRVYIRKHLPTEWPELTAVLRALVDKPLGPLALLPLASCAAVGGPPQRAIPVGAAWEVLNLAIRILDDLQDQDRAQGLWAVVGAPRAFNYSAALYAFSQELLARAVWPADLYRAIQQVFCEGALRLSYGQDLDLRSQTQTLDAYWRTIAEKNGSAFAMVCAAGALCGTADAALVQACHTFGHHLGLALQLFDDFEGLWAPSGAGDLAMGKVTLPVLYGLETAHPRRDELQQIVNGGALAQCAGRIREILDEIHARDFVVWTALQERDRAVAALANCLDRKEMTPLVVYVTSLFAHIEDIL